MDLSNLKEGMIVKNYKEMCSLLGEKVKSGTSKKSQIKKWDRYFSYDKQGIKFKVKEIFNSPKPKLDNNKGSVKIPYVTEIKTLMLYLLSQTEEHHVLLSKNQLLKKFNMINDNYPFCKQRKLKLATFMDINEDLVNEWYEKTDRMLQGNIESALNSLQNECIIQWQQSMTICKLNKDITADNIETKRYEDTNGEKKIDYVIKVSKEYRLATPEERADILEIESETLKILECENKQELVCKGKWHIFIDAVREEILKLDIAFYYDSYDIVFTKEGVKNSFKKIGSVDEDHIKNKINDGIYDRTVKGAKNRQQKDIDTCKENQGELTSKNMHLHLDDSYVGNYSNLSLSLLSDEADDITKDVAKTKTE